MILPCKKDCNFNRFLSVKSSYNAFDTRFAENVNDFASNAVKNLGGNSASQCRNIFPTLALSLKNVSATELTTNISK